MPPQQPDVVTHSTLIDDGTLTISRIYQWLNRLEDIELFTDDTPVKIVRNRSNPFRGALRVEDRT